MAIMIPSFPYGFKPESREDEMFYGLEKLPADYYVFYSYKIVELKRGTWSEKEMDFLIYNRDLGIMVIEAKAGKVHCDHGIWRYGSGKEMRDPFKQADDGRWKFHDTLEKMQEFVPDPIVKRCKFHMAVWFPSISKKGLKDIIWPKNADERVVLTAEDIDDPKETIERIFSLNVLTVYNQTNLSDKDHEFLLRNFLCPAFEILPPKSFELDLRRKDLMQC